MARSPIFAQKMLRDFEELSQRNATVRVELENRVVAEANALGFRKNAERRAEHAGSMGMQGTLHSEQEARAA